MPAEASARLKTEYLEVATSPQYARFIWFPRRCGERQVSIRFVPITGSRWALFDRQAPTERRGRLVGLPREPGWPLFTNHNQVSDYPPQRWISGKYPPFPTNQLCVPLHLAVVAFWSTTWPADRAILPSGYLAAARRTAVFRERRSDYRSN